jgi:hypothetical protein
VIDSHVVIVVELKEKLDDEKTIILLGTVIVFGFFSEGEEDGAYVGVPVGV